MSSATSYVNSILDIVKSRNPGEPEFLQAVTEVLESLLPVIEQSPKYREHKVLERIVEPERVLMFRVPWIDDSVLLNSSALRIWRDMLEMPK